MIRRSAVEPGSRYSLQVSHGHGPAGTVNQVRLYTEVLAGRSSNSSPSAARSQTTQGAALAQPLARNRRLTTSLPKPSDVSPRHAGCVGHALRTDESGPTARPIHAHGRDAAHDPRRRHARWLPRPAPIRLGRSRSAPKKQRKTLALVRSQLRRVVDHTLDVGLELLDSEVAACRYDRDLGSCAGSLGLLDLVRQPRPGLGNRHEGASRQALSQGAVSEDLPCGRSPRGGFYADLSLVGRGAFHGVGLAACRAPARRCPA